MLINTLTWHSLTYIVGIISSVAVHQVSPGTASRFHLDTTAVITSQIANRSVKSERLPTKQAKPQVNGNAPVQMPPQIALAAFVRYQAPTGDARRYAGGDCETVGFASRRRQSRARCSGSDGRRRHIRSRVIASIEKNDWRPMQLGITVRDEIVDLSGMITDERFRQAAIVAAENVSRVKLVHDPPVSVRYHVRAFVQITGR
jgi:hypothetical protein